MDALWKSNAIEAQSAISQGSANFLKMLPNVAFIIIAGIEILSDNRGFLVPGAVTIEAGTA